MTWYSEIYGTLTFNEPILFKSEILEVLFPQWLVILDCRPSFGSVCFLYFLNYVCLWNVSISLKMTFINLSGKL